MKIAFGVEARLAPGEVAIKLDSADSRHEKTQRAGRRGMGVCFSSECFTERGIAPIRYLMYTLLYILYGHFNTFG